MAETIRGANGQFIPKSAGSDIPVETGSGSTGDSDNGNSGDVGKIIDPAIIQPATETKRGAGRPAGAKNKPKPEGKPRAASQSGQKAAFNLEAIETLLFTTHIALATIAKTPELALTEDEAKNLAQATARVTRHYDLRAQEKTLDWMNLAITLSGVYGPRLLIIATKPKEQANGAIQATNH